jgi:hypothetical protein
MIDYKYPTIASGATTIRSTGRAPDEKYFEKTINEEQGRKFQVHSWWQALENKLDIYSHRESGIKNSTIFGHCIKSKILGSRRIEEIKDFKKLKN